MKSFLIICTGIFVSVVFCAPEVPAKKEKPFRIHTVEFDGNRVYSDKRLQRLMVSRPSKFLRRSYYYPEVLADDIAGIVNFYQRNGYLEAIASDIQVTADSMQSTVDIKITLEEGELTRVEGLTIFGNTAFPDSVLLQRITLQKGDPFKRTNIQDGMLSILSMYAEEGYLDAAVRPDVKLNSEKHLALIDLTVMENRQFTIADIRIQGLQKTHSNIVTRELAFRKGEIVRYSKLQESQQRLYLTGLFESVFIRPCSCRTASGDSTQKDILIEVKENLSSEFNAKVGYGSVEKLGGKVELLTTNLSGTARQIGAGASANFIKQRIETSFTEPRTFESRIRTDLNLFLEYLEEPGYDLSRYGGRLTVGKSFGRNSRVSLAYRYEDAQLKHVEIDPIPQNFDSRIRSLTLSITRDSRDNLFSPSRGTYQEWRNEFAGSFLKGNYTFLRSVAVLKWFYSPNPKTVLGSSLEVGWMDYFGISEDIPINERFYAGGPNSLRGFEYRMVGPLQDNDLPIGGRFKFVWNALEVRRAIYKMIGIGAFLDIGNVWLDIKDANVRDLRTCAGAGIRANTAIGVLRLDYGINLSSNNWEPHGKLYFSMGHAF